MIGIEARDARLQLRTICVAFPLRAAAMPSSYTFAN